MTADKRLSALPEDRVRVEESSGVMHADSTSSSLAAGGKTRKELNEAHGEMQFLRQHILLPL